MAENTNVVVIGGGYAGTMAANRLTQRDDVTVTLVNPRPQFVERVRLHQLVGGTHDAVHDFGDVLAKDVRLLVDSATRIDAAERTVELASGGAVRYDYLIYAVGSAGSLPAVPGAATFAYPLSTLEDAQRARAALDAAPSATAVTVVGAGPTGIETAAELAEQGLVVTLVCGGLLGPYLHAVARRSVAARLRGLGVRVIDGPGTRAAAVSADEVRLEDGRAVRGDVTLWTAGFDVPDLAARSGLRTAASGGLLTDETLTSVDDQRIIAAGDAAAPSGIPYRMSCQAAVPLGSLAADAVVARIDGRTPKEAALGFVGQCVSIGRRDAVYQIATSDDHARKAYIGGWMAAALKESGSATAYTSLVFEGRRPGWVNWVPFKDGRRRHLLQTSPEDTITVNTRVVVIGGGYAGVMAANRLTQRGGVSVTLVNPRPQFVERVRLHQVAAGTHDAVHDFGEVLASGVHRLVDTVERVDAPARTVVLASGGSIEYDFLVYAVGSVSAELRVPGAREFAQRPATLEDARRLRAVVDRAPATAPVTVVGGGPLGIEVAAELAEQGRPVTLACGGQLGPYLHPRARHSAALRLAGLGVRVLEGPGSKVTEVMRDAVRLADGGELASAVVIWAAGFRAPDLAHRSGLSTDGEGRLLTDESLTSIDDERIVATGDAASPSGLPLRMSCQAALPLGSHAADTVLARIAGVRPADFTRGIGAMCISLGRRAGVFQFARFDDTAIGVHVPGRAGAVLKEAACKSPLKQLSAEARRPGSHSWPVHDSTRRQRLAARSAEGLATAGKAG